VDVCGRLLISKSGGRLFVVDVPADCSKASFPLALVEIALDGPGEHLARLPASPV